MASPLKLATVVTLDTSQVAPGVQTTKQAISSIGSAADTSASQIQKLIDQQLRIGKPAATANLRGEDIAAYGQSLDQLRAKYNPLFAVISNYKSAVADIREANRNGAISADEMAAALTRQRQAALGAIDAVKGRSSETGPAAQFRRTNLTYQLFDIGQGAATGQPLGMIAAQQLPQIAQLYAGQGGANAALKDFSSLASGAARFITPVTAGVAGLTGALLLGAKAWGDYLASTKEVETAAAGLGRAVAGTQASLEASASAGASAAGISVTSARSMEAAFLRTGKIGSENYEKLISISKDFGATIGTDSDAAGQALAQMFADPEKAAQALYQQYGLIDAATARQATNLARQNRQSEAQAVLLDALPGKLASATEATTKLGRAWENVATAASNAWDWLGRATNNAISGPDLETQRAMAQVRLQNAQGSVLPSWLSGVNSAQSQVDDLNGQIQKRDEENARRQAEAERIRISQAASTVAENSPANADTQKIQSYRNDIAALNSGLSVVGSDSTLAKMYTDAIDAKSRALDALLNKQARAIELDRLDIQIQNERNPIARADLEARRTRLQLSDQEINSYDLENQAANARNKIILETISTAQTQTSDMRTEIGIRTSLTAQVAAGTLTADQANTQLQTELALRPLILAAATAEVGKRQELLDTVTKLRAAYDATAEAQRNANAASYVSDQQRNIDRLRFQTSIAGQGTNDQSMLLAQYDAEAKIRELGASTDLAAKIRANATETEKWNQQLARTTDAWNTIRRAEEDAIDSAVDKLTSGDFKGALDSIADDAKKTLLQLGVTNPLKNALTGSNYGTFGDVGGVGGVFKQMFGGDKSVSSMAVTAGTVMINGGVTAGSLVPGTASDATGSVTRLLTGANNNSALTGNIGTYAQAIRNIESSGNYSALGPITKSGDRAYGAYGIMGANIPSWTKGALGNSMTPSQFLSNQGAQDAVFSKYFGASVAKYGNPQDAASVWFTGRPQATGANAADVLGTTGSGYVAKFNAQLNSLGSSATAASANVGGLGTATGTAAQGLTNFGGGIGQFGNQLMSTFTGGGGSSGGGLFGSLFSSIGKLFGGGTSSGFDIGSNVTAFKGFDVGGYTGYGGRLEPAGVAHKGEVIWNQDDVRRVGGPAAAEAMRLGYRGYDRGGVVGGGQTVVNASNGDPFGKIEIHNYSNANVQAEQTTDERGARQTKFIVSDTVGDALNAKGGGAAKTLNRTFGVKRRGIAR